MTHIVHPYAHRLGILRDWESRWFGVGNKYKDYLKSDIFIKQYLEKKLRNFHISRIETERDEKTFRIIIKTSRVGMIIGRSGDGVVKLKNEILDVLKRNNLPTPKDIKVDIEEVRYPEADASIVAMMVAESLEKRMPFRRVLKTMMDKILANREVKGAKMVLSGRLGGAEMARREYLKKGRIPLQTFRADIDFARQKAHLTYGDIGIKIWIYKGDVFEVKKPEKVA